MDSNDVFPHPDGPVIAVTLPDSNDLENLSKTARLWAPSVIEYDKSLTFNFMVEAQQWPAYESEIAHLAHEQ